MCSPPLKCLFVSLYRFPCKKFCRVFFCLSLSISLLSPDYFFLHHLQFHTAFHPTYFGRGGGTWKLFFFVPFRNKTKYEIIERNVFYAMSTGEGERKTANVEGKKKKNMWSIKTKRSREKKEKSRSTSSWKKNYKKTPSVVSEAFIKAKKKM